MILGHDSELASADIVSMLNAPVFVPFTDKLSKFNDLELLNYRENAYISYETREDIYDMKFFDAQKGCLTNDVIVSKLREIGVNIREGFEVYETGKNPSTTGAIVNISQQDIDEEED